MNRGKRDPAALGFTLGFALLVTVLIILAVMNACTPLEQVTPWKTRREVMERLAEIGGSPGRTSVVERSLRQAEWEELKREFFRSLEESRSRPLVP